MRASLLLLVLLAGCASVDPSRGHAEVSRVVLERTGIETRWQDGTPEAEAIVRFVDAQLSQGLDPERAVAVVLVNGPALQATYEALGIAQADLVQAGLLSNPRISGSVGWGLNGPVFEWETSLVGDLLGAALLPLRRHLAEQRFETDVLRVAHTALVTAARARAAVVQVQARSALVELHRQVVESHALTAEFAMRRFQAGNTTELDLANLHAAWEGAKVGLANEELALVDEREQVNRLLGLWGPRTEWRLAGPMPTPDDIEPPLDELETIALRRRLDVDAARKQVLLLGNALELTRSTRLTGLVEVGVHAHQDPDGPRLFGPVFELELPIFDQRQAVIARLEAQERQARRRLDALSIDVRSEVRVTRTRYLTALRLARHLRTVVVPLRARALAQAQLQYNAMQLGLDALLAAKRAELEANRALVEATRDVWIARAELERVLGVRIGSAPAVEAAR